MAEQATAEVCPSAKSTTKEALVDAGLRIMLEKGYHHTVWARGDCAFCGDLYAAPRAVFREYVPQEEAPRRGDVLAIDNVILLVGDAAAIVYHAVQHQHGASLACVDPGGRFGKRLEISQSSSRSASPPSPFTLPRRSGAGQRAAGALLTPVETDRRRSAGFAAVSRIVQQLHLSPRERRGGGKSAVV